MGNLAGVVAAISFGGAGAVFWMWLSALIGSSSAFIESTLAQIYKEKDPLYGGFRGGPMSFAGIWHHIKKMLPDELIYIVNERLNKIKKQD